MTNSDQLAPQVEDDDGQVLDLNQADEIIPFNYEVSAYGADYDVDGLVRRIQSEDIQVPVFNWNPDEEIEITGFQREFVWTKPQADRFIESLLLGLPVPGIFLVRMPNNVLLVLDGHQRLRTLQGFYEGLFQGREFRLEKVQERFQGLRYKDLEPEDRRRIDNSIIHAIIVRQDQPSDDQSSVYLVFERLNSGGTTLQPQEIRVALYSGELVGVLARLNDNATWRQLYGRKSKRLKDMELILRFFALLYHRQEYASPMKVFLNRYMSTNRNTDRQSADELTSTFEQTVDVIHTSLGDRAFRPQRAVNAAMLDSVMVGVAELVAGSPHEADAEKVKRAYEALLSDKDYLAAIERGTANEQNVKARLDKAISAFGR